MGPGIDYFTSGDYINIIDSLEVASESSMSNTFNFLILVINLSTQINHSFKELRFNLIKEIQWYHQKELSSFFDFWWYLKQMDKI